MDSTHLTEIRDRGVLQGRDEAFAGLEAVDDGLACTVCDRPSIALREDRTMSSSAWVTYVNQGL